MGEQPTQLMLDENGKFYRRPLVKRKSAPEYESETAAQAAGMVEAVRSFVARAIAKNNTDFEKRLKKLEDRPVMMYCGVWKQGETYWPGNLTTDKGSMHYCWKQTSDRPGTSSDWQLCVKSGANGKDAR